jgi:hypothetical protein
MYVLLYFSKYQICTAGGLFSFCILFVIYIQSLAEPGGQAGAMAPPNMTAKKF